MRARFGLAVRDTFRSLAVRNFRLFFIGQFISQVGNWLTMIAQALLILKLTHSGLAVGIITACQFLPLLLFGPWTGLVADRCDKRKLLLVVQTAAMAQSFALAACAFLDHPPVLGLYAISLAGGFTVAFDGPARRSLVVEMVPETHVQNAVSMNSALMTSSRIFGPALAGLLITTVGYGWTFLVDGLSYVAVLVALWMIDMSAVRSGPIAARGRGQVSAGLRYVRQVPVLWISLGMMALVGTFTFNFNVLFPLFVKRGLHGDTGAFTLLFSISSVGSLIGALVVARQKAVEMKHQVGAALAFGLSMCLLAVAPNLRVAYLVSIPVGISSIAFLTMTTTMVQLAADPAMRGRVVGLQSMVFIGSTPIGGPILGAICDTAGSRTGVFVAGMAAVIAGVGGFVVTRSVAHRGVDDALEGLASAPAGEVLGEHLDGAVGGAVRAV